MKIYPTQEQLKKDFRYEDGNLFWLPRGNGTFDKQFAGKKVGCVAKSGYFGRKHIITNYKGSMYLVHRLVWIYHNGEIPNGMEVDHIDTNNLNNKIENLRIATSQQNNFNMPLRKDNRSGVKGVYWNKATKSWRARIQTGGKVDDLGLFSSIEDAANAVSLAREKHHGAFANNGNEGRV